MSPDDFRELVWANGRELYRDMPWRDEPSFYHVLVSEIMLQQTQVSRVLVKYEQFMQCFADIETLAQASLGDVLAAWVGLGYNRRAKFLHACAQELVRMRELPRTVDELVELPGVGKNTAGAIMNYVYEIPTAYVETNIRTVYFHHFFDDGRMDVSDKELLELVDATIYRDHPREWFWALMDYGSNLKSEGHGKLNMSRHYKKQSSLRGSVREVRGQIVRALAGAPMTDEALQRAVQADERYNAAIKGLVRDGMVRADGARWVIS